MTAPPPNEKKLRLASFAVHATRGLLRDQNARRKTMLTVVILAVVMLFCGATFLARALDPHAHPGWFVLYWFVCAWVTLLVMLLAVFDLLCVRRAARTERRRLQEKFSQAASSNDKA